MGSNKTANMEPIIGLICINVLLYRLEDFWSRIFLLRTLFKTLNCYDIKHGAFERLDFVIFMK